MPVTGNCEMMQKFIKSLAVIGIMIARLKRASFHWRERLAMKPG